MKTSQSKDWREWRRLQAWHLSEKGWSQKEIAEALGVTQGAVSQWFKRARTQGSEALYHHPSPGRPCKLTGTQHACLCDLFAQGAEAFGFRGDVWTTSRVAVIIKERFGVRYHPAHVSRVLRSLRYSQQKPLPHATQRNEAAIATWKAQQWPALKKKSSVSSGPWCF